MPGGEHKTSRMLLLLCMLMSVGCAGLLTESSSAPYVSDSEKSADVIVAESISPLDMLSGLFESPQPQEETVAETEPDPVVTQTADEEDDPELIRGGSVYLAEALPAVTSPYETSPEADQGVWTWDGTGWMFMVDGVPYTGWLNDVDGKRYHLNSDGYMETGWVKDDGERYYLDDDGIMMTGEVTIGKKTYIFADTGILQGEVKPTQAPSSASSGKKTETDKDADTKNAAAEDSEKKTESGSEAISEQDAVQTAAADTVKKKQV